MYGDTTAIRALARSMRERAVDLRTEADELAGRVEAVPWTGLAASAMRHTALGHVAGLRVCADAHDIAAEALDRHAREVDRLKDLIAAVESRARELLESAAGGLAGLVAHAVPDGLHEWALHFEPPPLGSRAWLDVRLPTWA
jgi:hypothetical protein